MHIILGTMVFLQSTTVGPGGMQQESFNITSFAGGLLLGIVVTYFFAKSKFKK